MDDEKGYKYTKTDVCATIFAIILLGVGYLVSSFISSSMPEFPEGFGPPPIIAWTPMIMLSIPLIICIIMMIRAKVKKPEEGPTIHRYRDETTVYTGDYSLDAKPSEEEEEKPIYLVPAECPSCGSSISSKDLDWIGPMQAKCPRCGATVNAIERE